jgi:hypothetical protein
VEKSVTDEFYAKTWPFLYRGRNFLRIFGLRASETQSKSSELLLNSGGKARKSVLFCLRMPINFKVLIIHKFRLQWKLNFCFSISLLIHNIINITFNTFTYVSNHLYNILCLNIRHKRHRVFLYCKVLSILCFYYYILFVFYFKLQSS